MAIISIERPDVSTDIVGAVKFSVDASAAPKLAQMLGNYLYSDKEYAVISELCANAYDIHRVTGKGSTPIKVNLPTALQPQFSVRDYGTGMSESDVYKFLTSYGASSKTDTNEQIGFWGLGSKSPSAVTDSWTVISHHDNVKTVYEVFIDSDGVPSLKKMFVGKTDESGLEVIVPVKNGAFHLWERAAIKAFTHYEVRPTLNKNIWIPTPSYSVKGNKWAITTNNAMRIVTTMREYDLDKTKIKNFVAPDDPIIHLLAAEYGTSGITMFFDIGDIDLSISREQIQYNQKTVNSIIQRLRDIHDHIAIEYRDGVQKIATLNHLTYRKFLSELTEKFRFNRLIEKFVAADGNKFGVVDIPKDIRVFSFLVDDKYRLGMQCVSPSRQKTAKITSSFSTWKTRVISLNYSYVNNTPTYYIDIPMEHVGLVEVVVNDCRGATQRIKHSGDRNKLYILVEHNFIPYLPVTHASKLAPPPRTKRNSETTAREYYVLRSNSKFARIKTDTMTSFNGEVTWDGKKLDFDSGNVKAVCIKIKNATQADRDDVVNTADIRFLRNTFRYEVIGYVNKKPAGMRTPADEIQHLYKELSKRKDIKENFSDYTLSRALDDLRRNRGIMMRNLVTAGSSIESERFQSIISPLKPLAEFYKKRQSFGEIYISMEANRFLRLAEHLNKPFQIDGIQIDFDSIQTTCNKIYPMLQYVNSDWLDESNCLYQVQEYIKTIDNQGV